jgi:hypothetical protein
MPFEHNRKNALAIAKNWGPYFTEAAKGGLLDNFKSMFCPDSPTYVVLQNKDGEEAEFSIGNDPDTAIMTSEDFAEHAFRDLEAQKYEKTESAMLGLLGSRMILETGRVNKAGEFYLVATLLVEFNPEGKIIGFEAFSDVSADETFAAVAEESF